MVLELSSIYIVQLLDLVSKEAFHSCSLCCSGFRVISGSPAELLFPQGFLELFPATTLHLFNYLFIYLFIKSGEFLATIPGSSYLGTWKHGQVFMHKPRGIVCAIFPWLLTATSALCSGFRSPHEEPAYPRRAFCCLPLCAQQVAAEDRLSAGAAGGLPQPRASAGASVGISATVLTLILKGKQTWQPLHCDSAFLNCIELAQCIPCSNTWPSLAVLWIGRTDSLSWQSSYDDKYKMSREIRGGIVRHKCCYLQLNKERMSLRKPEGLAGGHTAGLGWRRDS